VGSGQLEATVPRESIRRPGEASITVAAPDGAVSNPVAFTIESPSVTSLSPDRVTEGGPAFTLSVLGSGFVSGTTVHWNNSPLSTSFVAATRLEAQVPASLIALAATVRINVINPEGVTSNTVPFSVVQGLRIDSVAPSSIIAGTRSLTLVVRGGSFNSSAVVLWDGAPLPTTFVSGTELTASVLAELLAQPGQHAVAAGVLGSRASNSIPFTVEAPPPPNLVLSGPAEVAMAQTPLIIASLERPYPFALGGRLVLTFEPDGTFPDDSAVQFLSGGRTVEIQVPENTIGNRLETSVQSGTVPGWISIHANLAAAGSQFQANPLRIRVDGTTPVITDVKLNRTTSGLEVVITGYSPTREISRAEFQFQSATIQGAGFTLDTTGWFQGWYGSEESRRFGSQFTYVQPFTVSGDASGISSVEVQLSNRNGKSQPRSGGF
jgi:hypothetical protein